MSDRIETPYVLYQTFSCNVPKTNISSVQTRDLITSTDRLSHDHKSIMVRLIIEHARINNDLPTDLSILPYSGVSKNGDVEFTIGSLPHHLKWILLKFIDMINGQSL